MKKYEIGCQKTWLENSSTAKAESFHHVKWAPNLSQAGASFINIAVVRNSTLKYFFIYFKNCSLGHLTNQNPSYVSLKLCKLHQIIK